MSISAVYVPFSEGLIPRLAGDLLALPGAGDGGLTSALVVLPSARACRTLGHALLEQSDRSTLLLPRLVTMTQLAVDTAMRLGLAPEDLPDDSVRGMILAHRLRRLDWLAERPESAPGLADEYVALFDELRAYKQADWLAGGPDLIRVASLASAAEAETLQKDLERAVEVWRHYRRIVPRDRCDWLVEVAERAVAAPLPGPGPETVLVAGFGRLDAVTADLLRATLARGRQGRVYLARAESILSRGLLATWPETQCSTDPLAPTRRIACLLAGEEDAATRPAESCRTLRERLTDLGDTSALLAPDGPVHLTPCGDPEEESRWIVDRVVGLLKESEGKNQRTGIVVNDTKLAARINAQLQDAGIVGDDSLGEVLAASPAGLLVRFMLRAAVTGLRPEPLLEVLTHPYVDLSSETVRHDTWTLRLERVLRRRHAVSGGLAGLFRRARDRDEVAVTLFDGHGAGLADFVAAIADACEPLLALAEADGSTGSSSGDPGASGPVPKRSWSDCTEALTESWRRLAPTVPLTERGEHGDRLERPDVVAVWRLLAGLRRDTDHLPPVTLAEFAGDLTRLLMRQNVPPLRGRHLPVQVMGLVEARLESFDHLIIAGLQSGIFPARRQRPFLLGAHLRERMGLPTWRVALARDAELFLRLLHNADKVDLTWAVEADGQPILASPFVLRLGLLAGLDSEFTPVSGAPLWRTAPAGDTEFVGPHTAFATESLQIPLTAEARTIQTLSWTALRQWRDCPYRFLLERGFALKKEEEIQAAFGSKDHGSLVHETMREFLGSGGPGRQALDNGDRTGLLTSFEDAARRHFLPGADELPVRKLWLAGLLRLGPQIVDLELGRHQHWRPWRLEVPFELALTDLIAWIEAEHAACAAGADLQPLPTWPELDDAARACRLNGRIDRVDCRVDVAGEPTEDLAVVDYKTGKVPSPKSVTDLIDLQLLLYGVAVEAGSVGDEATVTENRRVVAGLYYGITEGKMGGKDLDLRQVPKPSRSSSAVTGEALWPPLLGGAIQLVQLALGVIATEASFPLLAAERFATASGGEADGSSGDFADLVSGVAGATLACAHCDFRGVCRIEEREHGLPAATQRKLDKLVGRKEVRSA